MKEIEITQGEVAFVDDEDYVVLNELSWCLIKAKVRSGFLKYAQSYFCGKKFSMHRKIMNFPKGMVIDHVDGNGLNNQKQNLRCCTRSQNRVHQISNNTKSGYWGVYKDCTAKNAWKSAIDVIDVSGKRKSLFLIYSPDKEICAKGRDIAYWLLHGSFASLNFPDRNIMDDIDLYQHIYRKMEPYLK